MLQKSTIEFLKKLKKNNNKVWFDDHREEYLKAKTDFETLVEFSIDQLAKLDPAYGLLRVRDCVFRINRDVRFSKDKSPYKTNFGAGFTIGGKKSPYAGFYIHLEPGNSFIGGGSWMPGPPVLSAIRQEIDYHAEEFKKLVEGKKFKQHFGSLSAEDRLKNPPKGYAADHIAVEYLKNKSFVAGKKISDEIFLEKAAKKEIMTCFETIAPLISFLNRAMA
ncbi:MAG: DUF2461 domain-containing protein [Chitinophagaceae bacterium]|nr:DUF2461 domain-containing protein [Chitinophagaceae bacterium]